MRFLLLPFSWIYTGAIFIRNILYDVGVSKSFKVNNSIGIGNLSMGGTGKTPLTLYLAQWLIKNNRKVYILSRGYKRNTSGQIEVISNHQSYEVGDEPLMYKKRLKGKVNVMVSKNRWLGSQTIRANHPDAFLLFDDVFQHRKVKTDFSIITSPLNDLFDNDLLIPAGRLREPKRNVKRAQCIMITRCPLEMSNERKNSITTQLSRYNKPVFFSSVLYDDLICFGENVKTIRKILLVTGIASNDNLKSHLEKSHEIKMVSYPDHYRYSLQDMKDIHQKFNSFADEQTIILTTEKDMVRMLEFEKYIISKKLPIYYQPISIKLHDEQEFISLIKEYVGKI